jgi:D-sedoheptulose 7-phosphate isomerase
MKYTANYKARLLDAIERIDVDQVDQVIQIFKEARSHGGRIFVCGDGGTDLIASEFLCDLVKEANMNHSARFRILPLSSRPRWVASHRTEAPPGRVFLEQLKNFAQPGDVVMGISASGGSLNVVRAIEYAKWIGCRTIAVTGDGPSKLSALADIHLQVSVAHTGSVEDAEMIICHMIGYYFLDFDAEAEGQG